MTDHDIDRFAVEQILAGVSPEEAPHALAGAAQAINALLVPARPAEMAGQMSVVARMAEAMAPIEAAQPARRPRMFPKFLTARFAVATVLGVASLGGVAAAASGSLPRPVQTAVADVVAPVISLPDSSDSLTTRTAGTDTGSDSGSGTTTTMASPTTSEPPTTVAPAVGATATTPTTVCPPDDDHGDVSGVATGSTPPTSSKATSSADQHGDEVSAAAHNDCADVEATTESDAKTTSSVPEPTTTEPPDQHGNIQTQQSHDAQGLPGSDSQGHQSGGDHSQSGGGSPSSSGHGSGD
jgi:hypothetical protein